MALTLGEPAERRYRLPPRDTTGLMFGRTFPQLALAAAGVVLGAFLMLTVGFVPGVVAGGGLAVFGLGSFEGRSWMSWISHGASFARFGVSPPSPWFAVVPLLGGDDTPAPGPLGDHDVLIVDAATFNMGPAGQKIAVSRDNRGATLGATVRVAGRQFSLLEPGEQDWLVAQWGTAIQAFIEEQTPVTSVRWAEWAAPQGLEEHRRWVHNHRTSHPLTSILESYERLLAEGASTASRHEVLVTLTVATKRVNLRRRHDGDRERAALEVLMDQVRLFTHRLESASLQVSAPLSPSAWTRAMRLRLDPSTRLGQDVLDRRQESLGEHAAAVDPANAAPLAAHHDWDWWRTDGAWHRALYVRDWPRTDVPASWMSQLMLWSGSVRSITCVFEPVPRSKSLTQITREAGKLQSDEDVRRRDGWRVGAQHRRAKQAVDEREEELVAGYGEFRYGGVVVVTGSSLDELDASTDEMVQVAAGVGIDLRPLRGRTDEAVCLSLPLARSLAPSRVW